MLDGKTTYKGTIKSINCTQIGLFQTCDACSDLPKIQSFKMKVRRLHSSDKSSQHKKSNHRYLAPGKQKSVLASLRAKYRKLRIVNINLAIKLTRCKASKQRLVDKIKKSAQRGDISAICENLHRAYEKGCLQGKSRTIKFIKSITQNIQKEPKGRRYDTYTKQLYEALKILGGPRITKLLAQNLCGPSEHTVRRSSKKFCFGPSVPLEKVFEHLSELYAEIKKKKGISGDVLVECAEDETVIIGQVTWDSKTDECWGWCGAEQQNHVCDSSFVHVVGDNENSFEMLKMAFQENRWHHLPEL